MKISAPTSSRFAPGVIAPKLAIVAGILVCVVSLIFLTPSRSELFKRHLADGDAKAASLLVAQREAGNGDQTTAALTAEAIRFCERDGWKSASLDMLCAFLRNNENFGPAAQEALRHLDRIPSGARGEILSVLARRSLRDGEVGQAQEFQMRLVESAAILTPETVRQAVTTYRYNSNPALALVTIDQLEKQRGSLPRDLRDLRVVLAKETSQPEVAFTLLTQRIRVTRDAAALRKLIPQAVKTGIEAGRQNDLIPFYKKYLEVVKATRTSSDPLIVEYSMKLAQTYEWTGQASEAFDIYLELTTHGNRAALDRCLALNPGLFRQEDVMNALLAGYDHYRADDQLLLLTARYLGEAARREESIRLYQEYLERNPDDAEAHYRLGAVFDEGAQMERALKHFERAHRLMPENNTYLAKLARLATTLRRYDEALRYLRILSERTRDRLYVGQFFTLADGLHDAEATKTALRLLIEIGGRLSPPNYIYLASLYREEGDLSGHLAVLKEALGKHPGNPFVRLDLAGAHLLEKRPDLALEVLQEVDLTHYPQAAQVAVNALSTLDQTRYPGTGKAYLQRFGAKLEKCMDLSPLEVVQLAEYCKKHGSSSRARRLFQRVVTGGGEPGHLARAHFHLGQYQSARRYQLRHLEASSRPTSHDYQLLGDIHSKLGENSSARRAYQKALAALRERTANTPRR